MATPAKGDCSYGPLSGHTPDYCGYVLFGRGTRSQPQRAKVAALIESWC